MFSKTEVKFIKKKYVSIVQLLKLYILNSDENFNSLFILT